jgi:ribosome biogenesis GTPase A
MDIMENEKRKSYAIKLEDVAGDFLQYISDEFSDCSSYFGEKIEEKVIKLLDFEKPKVMVYGIYNSGKSTLINALCREEVAENGRQTND